VFDNNNSRAQSLRNNAEFYTGFRKSNVINMGIAPLIKVDDKDTK
jgi:hypothetical protein